jgi:hypothetical protein
VKFGHERWIDRHRAQPLTPTALLIIAKKALPFHVQPAPRSSRLPSVLQEFSRADCKRAGLSHFIYDRMPCEQLAYALRILHLEQEFDRLHHMPDPVHERLAALPGVTFDRAPAILDEGMKCLRAVPLF